MPLEISSAARLELPYSAIGMIVTFWPDGTRSIGTGFLVGRNDVITAGHVVFSPEKGGYGNNYKFYFGADYNLVTGIFEDYGFQVGDPSVNAFTWPNSIYSFGSNSTLTMFEAQNDIALIGLTTPAGDRQGYLSIAAGFETGFTAKNLLANSIGYASGQTGLMEEALVVSSSDLVQLYSSRGVGLGSGSSGGPLIYKLAGTQHVVVGVKSTTSWWASLGGKYDELIIKMKANDTMIVDRLAPTILSLRPSDGTSFVFPNSDVAITFTEEILAGSGSLLLKSQNITQHTVPISDTRQLTLSGQTLKIDFLQPLLPGTKYELIFPAGYVKDLAGNAIAAGSFTFTTRSAGDSLEFMIANQQLAKNYNSIQDVRTPTGYKASLIQGTESSDQILGTSHDDYLLVYAGDDVIQAGLGNDRIYPDNGNDVGSGGAGIDTLVYACNFSEALIEPIMENGVLLGIRVVQKVPTADIGTDFFTDIERIEFFDYGLAFDMSEANGAGGIYRLYQAAFGRSPDLSGLGYWIEEADQGKNAVRMGEDFTWTTEFQSLYKIAINDNYASGGNINHIVKGFYQNILGRDPDVSGLSYYKDKIAAHEKTLGRVLAEIADSLENRNLVSDNLLNGILYRPYEQNVESSQIHNTETPLAMNEPIHSFLSQTAWGTCDPIIDLWWGF
jgi:hypothetical protein